MSWSKEHLEKEISEIIFKAVDEVNKTLPRDRRIVKSSETILYGPGGVLDSLGLTVFIVAVEQRVEQDLGFSITLTSDSSISSDGGHFQNLGSLIQFVSTLIKGN